MSDTTTYALGVLLAAAAGLAAVLSNRLTDRFKVPAPLLMLAAAAVAGALVPDLPAPSERAVEHVVTLALVLILFEGGMHIGVSRFRAAAGAIGVVGVLGTFLTTAAGAVVLHLVFGLDWFPAALVATAVAPTDPAIVFSVLGQRQVLGRSGTILEGESGANDPVGIALMASLLAAGGLSLGAFGHVGAEFVLQMVVGAVVGFLGGRLLLWAMRSVTLPNEALYPLRTLMVAFILFGAATVAHGSGFLAVFVAGIVIGDGGAPYKREIERFHSALASLGEIVAFVMLGLTVQLDELLHADVWVPGLVLGALLAVLIRPLAVGLCLARADLTGQERGFVLFAGLKGAVPILLGELLRAAHVPHAERLFGIVVVVVIFSVLAQGSLVIPVATWLRLPMRTVEPEPWALGIRLRVEPEGVHRLTVAPGSPAVGRTVSELADVIPDMWVNILVRESELIPVRHDTRLQAGDEVVAQAEEGADEALRDMFD